MLNQLIEINRKLLWIFLPLIIGIGLCYFSVLPQTLNETVIMVSMVIIFILGIPLSVGVRLDQWSFNMGEFYSRETVLFLALIIPLINLNIILLIRSLIYSKKETTQGKKEIIKK